MIRRGEMRFPSGQKKGNLNSPWEKDKPTWFVEMMSKLNYFSRNLYKNTPTCPSWRKHYFHLPLSLSAANSGTLINLLLILLVHFCLALVLLANSIWKHWNWLPQQTTRNSFQAQIWVELISESVIHYSSALVSKPFDGTQANWRHIQIRLAICTFTEGLAGQLCSDALTNVYLDPSGNVALFESQGQEWCWTNLCLKKDWGTSKDQAHLKGWEVLLGWPWPTVLQKAWGGDRQGGSGGKGLWQVQWQFECVSEAKTLLLDGLAWVTPLTPPCLSFFTGEIGVFMSTL